MGKVIPIEEFPEGEKVYLKQGWFKEWRVVYPIKNEDGTYNWFRLFFGSKTNLVVLIFILVLCGIAYIGIHELVSDYQTIIGNPDLYCNLNQTDTPNILNLTLNGKEEMLGEDLLNLK